MALQSLVDCFQDIEDPRVERTRHHQLNDILVLSVLAVMSGAEGWEDIEDYASVRLKWLRQIIPLRNGVPSHDTISRVFRALKPGVFQEAFLKWAKQVSTLLGLKMIAIDGKAMRRSHDRATGKKMLHSVMAWNSQNAEFLGQVVTDEKSNEITALPKLLELLELKGALITIDAMGCQKDIAEQIDTAKGDYMLGLKDNQPTLAKMAFEEFEKYHSGTSELESRQQIDREQRHHGRIEKRRYIQLALSQDLRERFSEWSGLKSIVQVISEVENTTTGKHSSEVRYYMSSAELGIRKAARSIRQHWGIEAMHWVLDTTFSEDASRIRKDSSAENFGLLRRFSLQLLKQDTTSSRSIKKKRKLAGWTDDFLLNVLKAID
jgi:predicted transposase YbfD/YdcC